MATPSSPNISGSSQDAAEAPGLPCSQDLEARAPHEGGRSPLSGVGSSHPNSVRALLQSILVEARRAGASGQLETVSVLQECAAYLLSAEAQRAETKAIVAEMKACLPPGLRSPKGSSSSFEVGLLASGHFGEGGNDPILALLEQAVRKAWEAENWDRFLAMSDQYTKLKSSLASSRSVADPHRTVEAGGVSHRERHQSSSPSPEFGSLPMPSTGEGGDAS